MNEDALALLKATSKMPARDAGLPGAWQPRRARFGKVREAAEREGKSRRRIHKDKGHPFLGHLQPRRYKTSRTVRRGTYYGPVSGAADVTVNEIGNILLNALVAAQGFGSAIRPCQRISRRLQRHKNWRAREVFPHFSQFTMQHEDRLRPRSWPSSPPSPNKRPRIPAVLPTPAYIWIP